MNKEEAKEQLGKIIASEWCNPFMKDLLTMVIVWLDEKDDDKK